MGENTTAILRKTESMAETPRSWASYSDFHPAGEHLLTLWRRRSKTLESRRGEIRRGETRPEFRRKDIPNRSNEPVRVRSVHCRLEGDEVTRRIETEEGGIEPVSSSSTSLQDMETAVELGNDLGTVQGTFISPVDEEDDGERKRGSDEILSVGCQSLVVTQGAVTRRPREAKDKERPEGRNDSGEVVPRIAIDRGREPGPRIEAGIGVSSLLVEERSNEGVRVLGAHELEMEEKEQTHADVRTAQRIDSEGGASRRPSGDVPSGRRSWREIPEEMVILEEVVGGGAAEAAGADETKRINDPTLEKRQRGTTPFLWNEGLDRTRSRGRSPLPIMNAFQINVGEEVGRITLEATLKL